ncbi:MAG: dynamin family protein [Rhodobacteraceae bacterium]|nr:dynamin family protein [Paracoccaceae bacterium]
MTFETDSSSPLALGANLAAESDSIIALLERLRDATDGEQYNHLFKPAEDTLANAITSISFIGQVKAGKTSLVNALIAKPNFLPSDVNPWTAVVTKIFFNKPGGPYKGARFSFFDDQQWDKFSNRGGRLGELASEIPESEEKLSDVKREVAQMRERAKLQLGNSFQSLLGKTHQFDNATMDVLARYICAGDDPEALVKQHMPGRYADITREAAVFFEKEKFAFPVALVDTPGINDPLMIREEITLQSLEHSQVFVLVLSAHQAFSSADLYLVRILNALRLDRLVIFVNRTDELTNPKTDIQAIRKHITKFMTRENPDIEIPIVFGSASCANNAISGEDFVNPAHVASLMKSGASLPKISSNTKFSSQLQQEAWDNSGVPALEQQISTMMFEGPGQAWLASARIDLDNAARLILANTETALEKLKQKQDKLNNKKRRLGNKTSQPKFDATEFESESERLFDALRLVLDRNMNAAWADIRTGLQDITEEFIVEHDREFSAHLLRAKKNKKQMQWSCDTTPLRRNLNIFLGQEFPRIQATVLKNIEYGVEKISKTMIDAGLTSAKGLRINTAELVAQSASSSALSKIVAIDMDPSWWQGWMSKFRRSSKIRENVGKMIRSQFLPIQNELVDSMSEQLVASSNEAITSYKNTLDSLVEIITSEAKQPVLTTDEEITSRIEELNARANVCKEVKTVLKKALAA